MPLFIVYLPTYAHKYQENWRIFCADTIVILIYEFTIYKPGHSKPTLLLLGSSTVPLSHPGPGIFNGLVSTETKI